MREPKRRELEIKVLPLARDFEIVIDSRTSIWIEVDCTIITIEVHQIEKDNDDGRCKMYFMYCIQTPKGNNFITPQQLADLNVVAFCEDCSNELHDKFIYYLQFSALDEEIWKVNIICNENNWTMRIREEPCASLKALKHFSSL